MRCTEKRYEKKNKSLLMTFTSSRKHCSQMLHVHFAKMKKRERMKNTELF